MRPNLAIFRVPSDDPGVHLVQIVVFSDGCIDETGDIFTVHEGDSYNDTDFDHIILAQGCPGGSHRDLRYMISNATSEQVTRVHELSFDELTAIVQHLCDEYEAHYETIYGQNDTAPQG